LACLQKARILKPADTAVARHWLSKNHVTAATLIYAIVEELLEDMFSVWSLQWLHPSAMKQRQEEAFSVPFAPRLYLMNRNQAVELAKRLIILCMDRTSPSSAI
jgi:hypothetical protein